MQHWAARVQALEPESGTRESARPTRLRLLVVDLERLGVAPIPSEVETALASPQAAQRRPRLEQAERLFAAFHDARRCQPYKKRYWDLPQCAAAETEKLQDRENWEVP